MLNEEKSCGLSVTKSGYDGKKTIILTMLFAALCCADPIPILQPETDPIFSASEVNDVNSTDVNHWGTAYIHSQDSTQAHSDYLLNNGDTASGNYNFDANTLFIDSSNNRIGIGTSTPLYQLYMSKSVDDVMVYLKNTAATGTYYRFAIDSKTATDRCFGTTINGSAYGSFVFYTDGKIEWGNGSGARDTNIYRSAASCITTDDWIGTGGKVPEGTGHFYTAGALTTTALFERGGATTNAAFASGRVLATKTSDMADGFGPMFGYSIRDDAGVINQIGYIGAVRAGADNTGDIVFYTVTTGTAAEKVRITSAGTLKLVTVKSGATQAAASAAAGEVWRTASHATLPDGVLMVGL